MFVDSISVIPLTGGPVLALVGEGGLSSAAVWPGIGATMRSVNYLQLSAGVATIGLEHPSDSVYYVLSGSGDVIDGDSGDGGGAQALVEGSMVHVDRGTPYRFLAGSEGMELFGGPCPADPSLYAGAVGA